MRRVKDITEWKIIREKIERPSEGITHALWETIDEEFGFYFYYINEWGILKNFGALQILKDKKNPQIQYDSGKTVFVYNPYVELFTEIDWTENGYLVLRQLKENGKKQPIIIIRLQDLTYISFDKFHTKMKLEKNQIHIVETFYIKGKVGKTDEEVLNLDNLEWKDIQELK
jgi:hypothetical protein